MLKTAEKILDGANPTLCFFGDSVTHGEFEFEPGGHAASVVKPELVYHRLLAERIRKTFSKDLTVINAGVGGDFTGSGLVRMQTDVLDKKPDFCCIMFGTNDVTNARKGDAALAEYKSNLCAMIDMLQAQNIETVLMTPGMLCSHGVKGFTGFWWFVHKYYEHLQRSGKTDAYAEAGRQAAREKGVPVADAYAEWKSMAGRGVDTTALLCNGLNHPNPKMHGLFAKKLFSLLFEE